MIIPDEQLHAYIRGGRIWPQKRCAINIYLLSSCTDNGTPTQFRRMVSDLLKSEPSKFQYERILKTANTIHRYCGVHSGITCEDLQNEWNQTKGYLAKTIVSYQTGDQIPFSNNKTLISTAFTKLVNELLHDASSLETETLIRSIQIAHQQLEAQKTNSMIFRLSFFSAPALTGLKQHERLLSPSLREAVERVSSDRIAYRRSSLLRAGIAINRHISSISAPLGTGWLTTGFFSE